MFLIILFVLGSCFGSFLCCEARRLHLKQKKKTLGSRSVCLNCHYKLKWYDNIPIFSWLFLRGKCRKCKKKIGLSEILSELSLGLAFLALSTTINLESADTLTYIVFAITLLLTLSLGFLAIYDGTYGELPVKGLILSIIIATILLIIKECVWFLDYAFSFDFILNPIFSVLILGGLYLILYLISKGKWVGDGDWLLGVSIGLALSSPWLALITLFIANVLACLVMAPVIKRNKRKKIYFGPFMVIAFIITLTFADFFYYAIGL